MKPSFRVVRLASTLLTVAVLVFLTTAPASEEEKDIVGLPSRGETAFAFLGRTDQHGPTLTHYGYLTHSLWSGAVPG